MLRKNTHAAMRRLWFFIRRRQLGGFRFRLQRAIGPHVVDFVCTEAKLIVELDPEQIGRDVSAPGAQKRDDYFRSQGYRMLRFGSHEIYNNIDGVLLTILDAVKGAGEGEAPPAAPAEDEARAHLLGKDDFALE